MLFSLCYLASPAKITRVNLFVLESWQVQDSSQALFERLKNAVQQQFLGRAPVLCLLRYLLACALGLHSAVLL